MRNLTCFLFASLTTLMSTACGDDVKTAAEVDTEPDDGVETTPDQVEPDVVDGELAADTADIGHDIAGDTIETVASDVATDVTEADSAPVACPPGTVGCDSIQWAEVGPFPHASDHHVTFVHTSDAGTYLYVAGGATSKQPALDIWEEVWRTKIDADHLLGAWEVEAPLPAPLAFQGLAQNGVAVYLLSGATEDAQGPAGANVAYVGRFDDDGHLAWSITTPLPPSVRVHPTAHYLYGTDGEHPDRVVVVGGTSDVPLASVINAIVQPNGDLGTWTETGDLPAPRSHHAGVVKDGRIWIFGGFTTDNEPVTTILRSIPATSGGIKSWEAAGTLDDPPWTHSATLYKDGVFLVGGGRGGPGEERYIARLRFARWDAAGALGEFVDVAKPLPMARSHVHQTPIFDGYLYTVGGRVMPSGNSIARTHVGYLAF